MDSKVATKGKGKGKAGNSLSQIVPQVTTQVVSISGAVMVDPSPSETPVYIRCSGEKLPQGNPVKDLLSSGEEGIFPPAASILSHELVENPDVFQQGCLTMVHVGYALTSDVLHGEGKKPKTAKNEDNPFGKFAKVIVPNLGNVKHKNPQPFDNDPSKTLVVLAAVTGEKSRARAYYVPMKPRVENAGLCSLFTIEGKFCMFKSWVRPSEQTQKKKRLADYVANIDRHAILPSLKKNVAAEESGGVNVYGSLDSEDEEWFSAESSL